jgi:hypothetical protein
MTFDEIIVDGQSEIPRFAAERNGALTRLHFAEDLFEAVANQDDAIKAEAWVDLENSKAVASEWGLISIADELTRELKEGRGEL